MTCDLRGLPRKPLCRRRSCPYPEVNFGSLAAISAPASRHAAYSKPNPVSKRSTPLKTRRGRIRRQQSGRIPCQRNAARTLPMSRRHSTGTPADRSIGACSTVSRFSLKSIECPLLALDFQKIPAGRDAAFLILVPKYVFLRGELDLDCSAESLSQTRQPAVSIAHDAPRRPLVRRHVSEVAPGGSLKTKNRKSPSSSRFLPRLRSPLLRQSLRRK